MLTTSAIILSTRDTGEAHRTYNLYTRDYGKVTAYATGVRKLVSKQAGQMTDGGVITVTLWPGHERMRLIHAERQHDYPLVRTELIRHGVAHAAREIVDAMTRPGVADEQIFALLTRLHVRLNEADAQPKLLFFAFVQRLLTALGHDARTTLRSNEALSAALEDHLSRPLNSIAFLGEVKKTVVIPAKAGI